MPLLGQGCGWANSEAGAIKPVAKAFPRPLDCPAGDSNMLSAPPLLTSEPVASPAGTSRPASRRVAVLPLLLIALLYLGASAGPALFDQNEAQYAGAAREMLARPQDYIPAARVRLESGHWYIPTNDGIPRLQKPPLVYWILRASMGTFGVNEFGARLPNALFTLLWFWAAFLLGRRIAGEAFGLIGATILATMAGTFIFSHLIAPEPFLAAFLTLTFWCFLAACQEPARAGRWLFFAWAFMGLGACSKGLHGALYPLAVAALLAWRHPETRPVWKKLAQPAGAAVFLVILIPWYAVVAARYPGFLWDQLINEQLGHVFSRRFPIDSDRVPLLVFWLEHLVFFVPWTFFIPAAFWAWKRAPAGRGRADALGTDLLCCWFGVTAISLLLASRQDYYLMTAWTPVAFWLARPWTGADTARYLPWWTRLLPGLCLALSGASVLAVAVYLGTQAAAGAVPTAAPTAARDTVAATLAGFSSGAWHLLLPAVWTAGLIFLGGGGIAIYLANRRWQALLPATAIMMTGILLCAFCGLNVLEDYFSLKRVALMANRLAGPNGEVVCVGRPQDNPSLLFYLDRGIYWVHADPADEFASRDLGIGRELFLSEAEVEIRWKSPRTVLLIVEARDAAQWQGKLSLTPVQSRPVAQSGTRVLLVNHGGPAE
jgi:4-amino-4-deoxy-L-arabinose transferase-like glycosyltransferase